MFHHIQRRAKHAHRARTRFAQQPSLVQHVLGDVLLLKEFVHLGRCFLLACVTLATVYTSSLWQSPVSRPTRRESTMNTSEVRALAASAPGPLPKQSCAMRMSSVGSRSSGQQASIKVYAAQQASQVTKVARHFKALMLVSPSALPLNVNPYFRTCSNNLGAGTLSAMAFATTLS